jgi:hypothetical protein
MFSDAVKALDAALQIQEMLCVKRPIVGPIGSIRARIAVHAPANSPGAPTSIRDLRETAALIAVKGTEGEVLVSDIILESYEPVLNTAS